MAKAVLLVLLVGGINAGSGVQLTEFQPIKMQSFMDNFRAFKIDHITLDLGVVYVNESLFYITSELLVNHELAFYVSITNLTSLTTTHQPVDELHSVYPESFRLFVLNHRVFIMFILKHGNRLEMTRLLVWDDEKWRPLNGEFPYVLGNQEENSIKNVRFRSNIGPPDVVYISSGCCHYSAHRYDFHRLEVIGDQVVIERVASFTVKKYEEIIFFTVWNGMLTAFVKGWHSGVRKCTMPIADEPLALGAESSFVVVESVPGLVNSKGYQIDRFVLFKGGLRYKAGPHFPERFDNATVLDLNTMHITDTDVPFDALSPFVVDEEGKRIFWIVIHGENEVASLLT